MTIKELFCKYETCYNDVEGELSGHFVDEEGFTEALKEFTKYHVERALKAAYDKSTILQNGKNVGDFYIWDAYNTSNKDIEYTIDKKTILNSYPSENII